VRAGHAPADYEYFAQTFDVCRFGFESAGALEFVNEYSGHAESTGSHICFAELKPRMSLAVNLA